MSNKRRVDYSRVAELAAAGMPFDVMLDLKWGLDSGVSVDDMETAAKNARSWSKFRDWLYQGVEVSHG